MSHTAVEYTIDEAVKAGVDVRDDFRGGPDTSRIFVLSDKRYGRTILYCPCGDYQCNLSTGICDLLTFGSGELDQHGYWENPCGICARDWERRYPDEGPAWPLPESKRQ